MRPVTLRTRLVAVLVACLLVSCAAVAVATSLALRHFLLDRLDEQLAAAGGRYATILEHPSDHDADNSAFGSVVGQPAGTLGARVLNGTVTAFGVVDEPGVTAPAATRAQLARLTAPTAPRTLHLDTLGEYRVIATAGQDGDVLITGLPATPVEETVRHALEIEAVVFAAALLISGAAAALFVRLSLRPLTRVARTALQVSKLPLATGEVSIPDRVDDPAPGTEVGQVAEAFNHMLEHIEAALSERHAGEKELRRFVADASHELRTPVAVVRSHAEYAQRTGGDQSDAVTGALERIVAESDRMGVLVDNLLLLARLDAGRPLGREPVDLTRVTLDAARDAQIAGSTHEWRLELPDEPVTVTGDDYALHQALANLLANARTHTPPGTTVTVRLEADGTRGVMLSVADDGPGIAPELQPRVFERLVHGSAAHGGSGLGLSIVAAIVAAHGGTIRLDSTPGRTVFEVDLPPR
jgi:two-component system OmpR family sensor kinase